MALVVPLMLFSPAAAAHEGTNFYDMRYCGDGWGLAALTTVVMGDVEAAKFAESQGFLGFTIHVDDMTVCGVRREEHWIQTVCHFTTFFFWPDSIPCRWYIHSYPNSGWGH